MKWEKKGLIDLDSYFKRDWIYSHASVPTPILLEDRVRVYVNFYDQSRTARVGFVDLDPNDLSKVIAVSEKPILGIGEPGTFDQDGVLQCSLVKASNNEYFMYYVGFEQENKIRYRLLSGLAVSNDKANSFTRYKQTPILERSNPELFFRGGPFVIKEQGTFKLWYVAGSDWINIDGKEMPVYKIKYQESIDGINWQDEGKVVIDVKLDDEYGFGRPYYFFYGSKHYLFYSTRSKTEGYIIGYAESKDGLNWIRRDADIGIHKSNLGFDSEMICYAAVIEINKKIIMFYNGNDFGKDGFAYAELISW